MISLFIASMNRPDLFERCVRSIRGTTNPDEVEVIAVLDCDRKSAELALQLCDIVDFSKEKRGAIYCWNMGLRHATGDMLMPFGDDQLCHPHWLETAMSAHKGHLGGYGMVAVNDLMHNGRESVGTTVIYDRQFCKDVLGGVAAFPVYHYYRIDLELNARAKAAGKYYWEENSIVEHCHSANGKRQMDDIDREHTVFWNDDERIYNERKAANWPNNFAPVI